MSECKRITCCQTDPTGLGPEQPTQSGCREITCCQPYAYTYTGTGTYTATCPEGTTGDPVTRTATATSYLSQEDANLAALEEAQAEAEAALQCEPEPPGDCCLYAAADLGTLYTEDDLPDTVSLGSFIGTKDGAQYDIPGWGIILSSAAKWRFRYSDYPETDELTSDCLIGEYTSDEVDDEDIQDNFSDTLELNTDLITYTLNRRSLCSWYWEGDGVFYEVLWGADTGEWKIFSGVIGGGGGILIKDPPQNTPVGTYGSWVVTGA